MASVRKRKVQGAASTGANKRNRVPVDEDVDDLLNGSGSPDQGEDFLMNADGSGSDDAGAGFGADDVDSKDNSDPYAQETPDERRLRLAKQILKNAGLPSAARAADGKEKGLLSDDDDEDGVEDPIAHRLQKDVLKEQHRFHRTLAHKLIKSSGVVDGGRLLRGHRLSVTCTALTPDEVTVFSGSKDGSIIRWDVDSGKKVAVFPGVRGMPGKPGHTDEVLSMALSSDGIYLASGGRDKAVRIWDTRSNQQIQSFPGHRDAVTGLAFRRDTRELFSASADRTVKLWNLEQMAYVETLFGHQSEVSAIDSLYFNRAVTCGVDRTVRLWKVVEETQLLFKGHDASIDCVAMLTEDKFIAGSQDGGISLWSTRKKKPVSLLPNIHAGQWITAVAALPFTDLAASGSSDGVLRLWEASDQRDALMCVREIPVVGFVNSLAFAPSGRFLIAGVGQEHRLGRWTRVAEGRNGVRVIPLKFDSTVVTAAAAGADDQDDHDDDGLDHKHGDTPAVDDSSSRVRVTGKTTPVGSSDYVPKVGGAMNGTGAASANGRGQKRAAAASPARSDDGRSRGRARGRGRGSSGSGGRGGGGGRGRGRGRGRGGGRGRGR